MLIAEGPLGEQFMLAIDRPILSPVLVGRMREVDVLETTLRTVRQGAGQVVLLAGEAGVGKSRLVAELRQRAAADHWTILADQIVTKLDANSYSTEMVGLKYKLAHKRAGKEAWSTSEAGQRKRLIALLKATIGELEQAVPQPSPERATKKKVVKAKAKAKAKPKPHLKAA